MKEKNKSIYYCIRLDASMYESIHNTAEQKNIKPSKMVREIIAEKLAEMNKPVAIKILETADKSINALNSASKDIGVLNHVIACGGLSEYENFLKDSDLHRNTVSKYKLKAKALIKKYNITF
jgi:predicted DNA-binding protein